METDALHSQRLRNMVELEEMRRENARSDLRLLDVKMNGARPEGQHPHERKLQSHESGKQVRYHSER